MNDRRQPPQRGFTLVELLLAAVVIGTAFLAATWSANAAARTRAAYDQASGPAFHLAKEIHELAVGLPRTPSGTTGVTSGAAVVALDSLVGAAFDPAIASDGTASDGHADYSQHVTITVHDMAAPATPTGDAPEDGLPSDGDKLYRLSVLVRENGRDLDTFHWWITP